MWTWLAIISIIVSLILVITCFIWLYILAVKQDANDKKNKHAFPYIVELLGFIIDSPDEVYQNTQIDNLRAFIEKDKSRHINILSKILIEGFLLEENDEKGQKALFKVYDKIKPQKYYSDMLREGSSNEKTYACKMLAAFYQVKEIPEIRSHIFDRNNELVFNAVRALAVLGDEDGLCEFIVSSENKFEYSHRIILELFNIYSGDIKSLASRCLEKCNDYMKSIIIKAVAKYKIEGFEEIYIRNAKHKDPNIRVASIKALCEIGNPKYEQVLITATHDNMWFVRSEAVKGLGKINTPISRQTLLEAVQDKEWWVRYNAARTLVNMDEGLELAEKVLSGYDRYAADAVKNALYKTYNSENN